MHPKLRLSALIRFETSRLWLKRLTPAIDARAMSKITRSALAKELRLGLLGLIRRARWE